VVSVHYLQLLTSCWQKDFRRSEIRHRETSIEQGKKEALKRLEETLASAVQHLFAGEARETIRTNVMTVSGGQLRILASVNMLVFPDHKMRLRKGQGCAGSVWEKALEGSLEDFWKPVYANEAQLAAPLLKTKWRLTEAQISLTQHILWILSMPLFHAAGGQRTFIGVLNFDGVQRPLRYPERLSQPDFYGRCVAVGERVAETVVMLSMFHSG
jgi:hypothetical protein